MYYENGWNNLVHVVWKNQGKSRKVEQSMSHLTRGSKGYDDNNLLPPNTQLCVTLLLKLSTYQEEI